MKSTRPYSFSTHFGEAMSFNPAPNQKYGVGNSHMNNSNRRE